MFTSTKSIYLLRPAILLSMALSICCSATPPTQSSRDHGEPPHAPMVIIVSQRYLNTRAKVAGLGAPTSGWLRLSPSASPLGFSGNRTLLLSFTTPEGKASYSPRSVHCILLDAHSGRVLATHKWSVLASMVGVLPTQSGNFVVRTRTGIHLYSRGLTPIANYTIALDSTRAPYQWDIAVTPSRKFVVLEKHTDHATYAMWLNSANLTPAYSTETGSSSLGPDWYTFRFAENRVAQVLPWGVQVRQHKGAWNTSYNAFRTPSWLGATFISENTLLVCQESLFFVVRTDGRYLLSKSLGPHNYCRADARQASVDGRRLAVPVFRTAGTDIDLLGLSAHPILKRVLIYDLPSMRLACEFDGQAIDLHNVSAMALSPDGSQLALLRGGFVELYHLAGGQ